MPSMTFTARGITALDIPDRGRIEYFDKSTPSFGLRVTSSGHRSWICLYRHKGEKRRYTIGTYPQLGLADARDKAKEILWRAAKGEDPATEKKREQAQFMLRCGFDAFEPADGTGAQQWQSATQRFRHVYQRAADDRVPAFVEREG